jgi:hypothetical protein
MNCAIHPEATAAVYCRTCGKALCESCQRDVKGVIYCEDCLAARVANTMPTAGPYAAAPAAAAMPAPPPRVVVTSGPSPGLAGVLAGLFPFGVGAVYCGEYIKGLVYLGVFAGLVWGETLDMSDGAHAFLGLALAFFYVYQIVDAVRAAKALQMGQPAPDPFGVNNVFGGGKIDTSHVPVGALILILIGVLFLLDSLFGFEFWWLGRLWPLILIVLGVWMFIKRAPGSSEREG